MIKDHGQLIRSKLLNISKVEKQEYMKVLGRYFHERLLYRISISRYKSNLMLKGSSLLYAHYQFAARPTIDIDLLGEHIDRDQQNLITVFKEILSIPCDEDVVTFDIESIKAEPIAIEKKYPGTNLSFEAHLHTIVYGLTIGGWIKHLNLRPYTVKLYFNGRMPKSNVTFLTAQRWTLLYHTL